jgi:hypothetical protein
MKQITALLLFLVCISSIAFGQKEKDLINESIVKFFDGLSAVDAGKLKEFATADFVLLEDGEVWNMDTLVSKIIGQRHSAIIRTNKFRFLKTEQIQNAAWVSYYNTAEFSMNETKRIVRWLESAVLRKEKGTWKIQLLHSTRLR